MIDTDTFLKENAGMLYQLAQKFALPTSKFSMEDLVQEANASAIRVLTNNFDESRGTCKAQTFVYQCVFRDLRDFVRKNKYDLYVTPYQQKKAYNAAKESDSKDENGNIEVDTSGRMAMSLDGRVPGNNDDTLELGGTLASGSPPAIEEMVRAEQIDILRQEMETLTEREQRIVRAHYFDNKSYTEISKDFSLTRQRIEQISNKALDKLRRTVIDRLDGELYE